MTKPCPNCGYCPTCGRANPIPAVFIPAPAVTAPVIAPVVSPPTVIWGQNAFMGPTAGAAVPLCDSVWVGETKPDLSMLERFMPNGTINVAGGGAAMAPGVMFASS